MKNAALTVVAAASLCLANVTVAKADPPPWAPAHGWRDKHEQHEYYEQRHFRPVYVMPWRAPAQAPYGIAQGTCYRETLGAVLGGGTGAVVGSTIGKGSGRVAAIVGGTILGVLAGGAIGHAMDEVDQNCIGQTLEHAPTGQRVVWRNPSNNQQYAVVPRETYQAEDGRYCREYTADAHVGGRTEETYGMACRQPDGSWQIVN